MKKRPLKKLLHVGKYVAEVEVELLEDKDGWSPYISVNDAKKLDKVRKALKDNDLKTASQLSRIFTLTPIAM